MMVAVERDLTTGGPQELVEVATIRKSLGHDWRVCVKDAGHGPAISRSTKRPPSSPSCHGRAVRGRVPCPDGRGEKG